MNKLTKKYKELFYRLSSHADFERLVKAARREFGIDEEKPEPFPFERLNRKQLQRWERVIDDILLVTMPKYMYPEGDVLCNAVEVYVLGGMNAVSERLNDPFYSFGVQVFGTLPANLLEKFGERYESGAFVYLPPYVTKNDFIAVMNKKWPEVKAMILAKNKQGGDFSKLFRLRSHTKNDRDKIIFDLYNKSRAELGLKRGDYKEIKVAALLKKQGIKVEPENIKMIVSRYRKLIKGNI